MVTILGFNLSGLTTRYTSCLAQNGETASRGVVNKCYNYYFDILLVLSKHDLEVKWIYFDIKICVIALLTCWSMIHVSRFWVCRFSSKEQISYYLPIYSNSPQQKILEKLFIFFLFFKQKLENWQISSRTPLNIKNKNCIFFSRNQNFLFF